MSIFSVIDKIVPSRKVRRRFLNPILAILGNEQLVKLMCFLKLGRLPDLKNPQRFTDKIALYRIKFRDEILDIVTNKYKVRKYIEEQGYGSYLNKMYAIVDDVEEIDFSALPNEFVIKDTLGDYKKEVLIVKDKTIFGEERIKNIVKTWDKKAKSQIIVEELLHRDKDDHFFDYKFFCFQGHIECLYVVSNNSDGTHELSFYTTDLKPLNVYRTDSNAAPIKFELVKPENWEEMLELAKNLSAPFLHCRVDLYNINGKVYFGELTFCTGGGYCKFVPDSFDFVLGKPFDVSTLLEK